MGGAEGGRMGEELFRRLPLDAVGGVGRERSVYTKQ